VLLALLGPLEGLLVLVLAVLLGYLVVLLKYVFLFLDLYVPVGLGVFVEQVPHPLGYPFLAVVLPQEVLVPPPLHPIASASLLVFLFYFLRSLLYYLHSIDDFLL
jgi:hypothetical protein